SRRRCRTMRARRTVVVVALALCAGAAAAPARAERIQPLKPNARPSGSALLGFRDRVIDRRPRAAAALSTRAATRTYTTPDGIPIEVTTSPSVSGSAQSYVDFLGSRLHGDELTRLGAYIGT